MHKKGWRYWIKSKIPYPFSALVRDIHRASMGWPYFRVLFKRALSLIKTGWAVLFLPDKPPLPIRLQVENTNKCNLSCIMCGREFREIFSKDMPNGDFERLVREVNPSYLTLNGDGEPLLDRGLFDKIKFAKGLGCLVLMPTNMTITTAPKAEKLFDAGLDTMSFSIDGATKESFEAVRKGSKFEKVMYNVRATRDLCEKHRPRSPELMAVFVVQRNNLRDYQAAYGLQKELGIPLSLVHVKYLDRDEVASRCQSPEEVYRELEREMETVIAGDGSPDTTAFYRRWLREAWLTCQPMEPGKVCYKPWTTAYVDARGDVYPCCFAIDAKKTLRMGNAFGEGFRNVWRGEKYRSLRSRMLSKKRTVPICATCTVADDDLHRRFRKWMAWLPVPMHFKWRNV